MADLTKEVPEILRGPIAEPSILTSLLPKYLDDLDLDTAIRYIEGAIDHQNRVSDDAIDEPKGNARWFTINKLEEVEIIERTVGDSNWVLGKKARLHFREKHWKKDEIVDQTIDTGWIEFNGFNKEQFVFEIALANTLKEIAEEGVGKTVYAQKLIYETTDGDPARYLGNLRVKVNQDDDDEDDRDSRKSHRKSSSSKGKSGDKKKSSSGAKKEVKAAVEELDEDEILTDEDIEFLIEDVFGDGTDVEDTDILEAVGEYLDIEPDDVAEPRRLREKDPVKRAVLILMENVEEEDG